MEKTIGINLLSFKDASRILHLSWFAFFISFFVWFNHAPLLGYIREALNLTDQEISLLLILNVSLTIPARVLIGMIVDRYGPKLIFTILLLISGFLCFGFALGDDFETLALFRFLLGFTGAGFVIGIRLISEWFSAKNVGLAEGIYGGWGNFGSAFSAMSLPMLALWFGGDDGWRYAIMTTGVVAIFYAFIFYHFAQNSPKGATYFKAKKNGAMEVSSKKDLLLYIIMKLPLILVLALLTYKVGPEQLGLLDQTSSGLIYIGLIAIAIYQLKHILKVNQAVFEDKVAKLDRYDFKQVALLCLAYMLTFGSELAIVSILPLYYMDIYALSAVEAGLIASSFAFMNLLARPIGGLFSDKVGRKKILCILLIGASFGYACMSQINADLPIVFALFATILCSFFVQAGEGAVFATVPLIKRRMTGQIAGMVGAYGNVGGVCLLTLYAFSGAQVFFISIALLTLLLFVLLMIWMKEPKGHMAELNEDGSVELIEIS